MLATRQVVKMASSLPYPSPVLHLHFPPPPLLSSLPYPSKMVSFTSTPTQFFISSSLTIQNHLIFLFTVIIVTFSHGTTAQDHSSHSPPPYFGTPQFNPTMAIIIVILITAFFFLGFFSIYLKQCGNDPGRSNWGRAVTAARSRRVRSRGFDPELIEKFPTLVYSDVKVHKIGKGALECAVCLSEFEDDQMLRLLPICDHVFHPECIDQWLESHTTCPVCRTNLAVVVDSPDSNVEQERGETPAEAVVEEGSGGGDSRSPGRRDEVEQVDCPAEPPPVLDLRRGGSLRAAARSILAWGSKSARPAVGAHTGAGQIWSDEERERFTLRLPDYVRQEVLAGKLSRSVSVTVFPTEESLRRGFRGGGGGMDGEGSSRGGGRSWKLRGGGPARSDRWAFLTSFNWRSVAGGGGDGEGSIKREGSINREGSTRRGCDGGGLEGSPKGKPFGPLDCLGGGGNSSVMRNESTTGKDAGDEESQTVAFAKM